MASDARDGFDELAGFGGDGHDAESGEADEFEAFDVEAVVGFDVGEGEVVFGGLVCLEIDDWAGDVALFVQAGVFGIFVGFGDDFGEAGDAFLIAGVIDVGEVAGLHAADVDVGGGVIDAVPDRGGVAFEIGIAVVVGFGFAEPVVGHGVVPGVGVLEVFDAVSHAGFERLAGVEYACAGGGVALVHHVECVVDSGAGFDAEPWARWGVGGVGCAGGEDDEVGEDVGGVEGKADVGVWVGNGGAAVEAGEDVVEVVVADLSAGAEAFAVGVVFGQGGRNAVIAWVARGDVDLDDGFFGCGEEVAVEVGVVAEGGGHGGVAEIGDAEFDAEVVGCELEALDAGEGEGEVGVFIGAAVIDHACGDGGSVGDAPGCVAGDAVDGGGVWEVGAELVLGALEVELCGLYAVGPRCHDEGGGLAGVGGAGCGAAEDGGVIGGGIWAGDGEVGDRSAEGGVDRDTEWMGVEDDGHGVIVGGFGCRRRKNRALWGAVERFV